jgi:GTPase SAR1 family protein
MMQESVPATADPELTDRQTDLGQIDLDRVTQVRQGLAEGLGTIANTIEQSQQEKETSGSLGLEREVATLKTASDRFRQGRFRLLILGDMKRGKSTFLNALLGTRLLPSDVNPCTALLTIVQAGEQAQVTIYFKDETREPEVISFEAFGDRYTISPDESKQFESNETQAFPQVSHAVIQHPLPMLGTGIEFVDTPGLNDTEARNELSLNYAYNCNAILFLLDATQPCTLEERRYLQNYLRDRGLTIFFLINRWDELQAGLVDPTDAAAVAEAENRQREVFKTHLAEYCQTDDAVDLYNQRVFEISALNALRARLQHSDRDLSTTGFPAFLEELNRFLVEDRAQAELIQAQAIANQAQERVAAAVDRRIPLLDTTVEELQAKIAAVEANFNHLAQIGEQFQADIRTKRDQTANKIKSDFRRYLMNLEETFITDFVTSQDDLGFFEFLDKNNRNQFYFGFKRAFERYMNDRLAAWEFMAKQQIATAFTELDEQAKITSSEYSKVLETMNEKLMGDRYIIGKSDYKAESVSTLFDSMIDFVEAVPGNLNSAIRPFNQFWQTVLLYACITIAVIIAPAFISLGMVTAILAGLGIVSLQTEAVRQRFLETTKKEFAKQLPNIAAEYAPTVYQAVEKCFDVYAEQVADRVAADIEARKAELANLMAQKQAREIDRDQEVQRLQNIVSSVTEQTDRIKAIPRNNSTDYATKSPANELRAMGLSLFKTPEP